MRVLVVGAGAIGGYFGGRLAEAGRHVTFLVRPARAQRLAESGLQVKSRFGDLAIANPPTVLASDIREPFDLVLLSCKAYDLDDAMGSLAPAVGPRTAVLPLLNGMAHLDRLDERFGRERVLGGLCAIGATLDPSGTVRHLNDLHIFTYGERDGGRSARAAAIETLTAGANFTARASTEILLEMWEKWVFLAALAAGTSLMRSSVGDVVAAPGGTDLLLGLLEECRAVAEASGYSPRETFLERTKAQLTAPGSPLNASMARDIEGGNRIEADHVIGDLIRRGRELGVEMPLLALALTHLKAYENRRAREAAPPPPA